MQRNISYACYDVDGTVQDAVEMGPTWNKIVSTIQNIQNG